MPTAPAARRFVPAGFDPADVEQIDPLGRALLEREIPSADALRGWVLDLSELLTVIYEHGTRCNIDNACHTDDEAIEARYMHFIREVQPRLAPLVFELQKKHLASPYHKALAESDEAFAVMNREWKADVGIYRDENVPIHTRCAELSKDYGKVQGAMTVEFEGRTRTMQQMAAYLEETDRARREAAWRAMAERRLQDRPKLDDIFDELLTLRHRTAVNAGFADYRAYKWVERYRFDYTPADCDDFANAVEKLIVPINRRLDEQRRSGLGVDTLRPWDGAVDVHGRSPLRPFDPDDIEGFVETTCRVFARVAPQFGEQLRSLQEHGDLDLGSRKGKRPGGFQASLEDSRRPFIFMNAAGLQRDVETLLHEGGHAFHYLASRNIEPLFVRHAPIEFCEVASMSMELLALEAIGEYFDDRADADRARRHQLEGALRTLAWIATIDQFQHWLYTHPGHSRDARTEAWLRLYARFGGGVTDWSGLDEHRRAYWQRQVHLYSYPFYYIEYGIAQLGAMRIWLNHRTDGPEALKKLRDAFALGGTRPLPVIFQTAGIPFRFDADVIAPLIREVERELAALPA